MYIISQLKYCNTFLGGTLVNFLQKGKILGSGVLQTLFQVCHERWLFLIMLCAEVPRQHQPWGV